MLRHECDDNWNWETQTRSSISEHAVLSALGREAERERSRWDGR